jgi:hypothetical protein
MKKYCDGSTSFMIVASSTMDCTKRVKHENDSTHHCIVNLGLFRTGTTTLAKAAEELGLETCKALLNDEFYREFIVNPENYIKEWWLQGNGWKQFLNHISRYHMVCDSWVALREARQDSFSSIQKQCEALFRCNDKMHRLDCCF